ncbi:uncharacterized protein LOC144574903 isoform X6 [Carex rostrata]
MGKEAKQINPLIFIKIILPFAFPLVGFLLPPLFPISTPSETDSYVDLIQEEEEIEDQHKMDSLVLAPQTEFVTENVVRIEEGEEELSLREEIERLNGRVSNVEERENQIKLEFSEYCNMKNYESLIKEKCTSKMKELTIEQGNVTSLTQNKEMSNQIERIRAEWAADMEEMIYIGWITTCLRHELSTTNKFEETKHEPELKQNVLSIAFEPTSLIPLSDTKEGEEEIMEVPVRSDEAQEGNEVIQSEPLVECANSITDPEENCMDAMVRKGSSKNLEKPKLMHKLKGWAKGKGKCRRS